MLEKFNEFITENEDKGFILYHGSPYVFKDFRDSMAFFSKTPKFAVRYSEQKSQDYVLDREANLYEVRVKPGVKIFDINNKEDEQKIRKLLPSEIEFSYNNFGFTAKLDKEEFILNMKGYYTNSPDEEAVGKNVGDTFDVKIAMSQYEKYKVYDKNDEYIYAFRVESLNRLIREITDHTYSKKEPYGDMINFIKSYINDNTDEKWISDQIFMIYLNLFQTDRNIFGLDKPNEKYQKEFDKLYQELTEKLTEILIKKGYGKKFNITERTDELTDTWRYYENMTILDSIGKLGYDGYVAKEDNILTYAIFDPQNSVDIIEYNIPVWREFKSWDEYLDFIRYDKKLYDILKDNRDLLMVYDRHQLYKNWKNKVSVETYVEELKNKNNKMDENIKKFENFKTVNFSDIRGELWDSEKIIKGEEGFYPHILVDDIWTLKENPNHSDYTYNKVIYVNEDQAKELNEKRMVMLGAKKEYEDLYKKYRRSNIPYKFQ